MRTEIAKGLLANELYVQLIITSKTEKEMEDLTALHRLLKSHSVESIVKDVNYLDGRKL